MSDLALILATIATAIGTIVIAFATVGTWHVYRTMSKQIDKQIAMTRDLFLESHKPALSVSITDCEYSEPDEILKMRIIVHNHGTDTANQVRLRISFDGSNRGKSIGPIAIQSHGEFVDTFAFPMTLQGYETGQMPGNRLNALIEGSYQGFAGHPYPYHERQEYDGTLRCFVPNIVWG